MLVLSLLHPHTDGEDRAGKVRLYAQAKEFRRRFQEVFGLTRCGDLLRARPASQRGTRPPSGWESPPTATT